MNKDVDTVLEENGKVFDRTFEATEIRLKEMKGTIIRESDRVIESILAGVNKGPQDRIVDRVSAKCQPTLLPPSRMRNLQDIYHIWQEMVRRQPYHRGIKFVL